MYYWYGHFIGQLTTFCTDAVESDTQRPRALRSLCTRARVEYCNMR